MRRVGTVLVEVDESTYAVLAFAASQRGITVGELVRLAALDYQADAPSQLPGDPWTPVPVHGTYLKTRTDGEFVRATGRLTVTTGALAGQTFPNPTAASRAVVQVLNPARRSGHTDGWRFWRVSETGKPLDTLRRAHPRRPDATS